MSDKCKTCEHSKDVRSAIFVNDFCASCVHRPSLRDNYSSEPTIPKAIYLKLDPWWKRLLAWLIQKKPVRITFLKALKRAPVFTELEAEKMLTMYYNEHGEQP